MPAYSWMTKKYIGYKNCISVDAVYLIFGWYNGWMISDSSVKSRGPVQTQEQKCSIEDNELLVIISSFLVNPFIHTVHFRNLLTTFHANIFRKVEKATILGQASLSPCPPGVWHKPPQKSHLASCCWSARPLLREAAFPPCSKWLLCHQRIIKGNKRQGGERRAEKKTKTKKNKEGQDEREVWDKVN